MFQLILILLLSFVFSSSVFAGEKEDQFLEAAKIGDNYTINRLLDEGVDIHVSDWAGWPALTWASLMLRTDTIKLLVTRGAEIEVLAKGGKNSGRPLMMAAKKYKGLQTTKLLIDLGANVNGTDQYGRSALTMAARYGRIEIVKHLLSMGAKPNVVSLMKQWETPLSAALLRGHKDIVLLLKKNGAIE